MATQPTIVVGLDGSRNSEAAARFALAEAALRGAALVAVQVFEPPPTRYEGSQVIPAPDPSRVTIAVESRLQALLRGIAHELGGAALEVPVEPVGVLGHPVEVLLDRARHADLLVVGHRGHGAVSSTLLGSVGLHCVLHATCPVTVVPPATMVPKPLPTGPISAERHATATS